MAEALSYSVLNQTYQNKTRSFLFILISLTVVPFYPASPRLRHLRPRISQFAFHNVSPIPRYVTFERERAP
jgi:hypothetical protein